MKIAILTSGILPVPAVQGGAVENLIDFYLYYNHCHRLHDITVFSVYHPAAEKHPALQSDANHYVFLDVTSVKAKILKRFHHLFHKQEYYYFGIEYYLDLTLRRIKKEHFDLIILENRPFFALRMKGLKRIPILCHQHTDTINADEPLSREVCQSITQFITVSDFIGHRIATVDDSPSKSFTVHNGIDLTTFSPTTSAIITREQIGLTSTDFVVLYSGRVMPRKGITELIEAINLLNDQPQIKLLIIGSSFYADSDSNDSFSRMLKAKAAPVSNRIIFTGFVPYSAIPSYLQLADVAAIPSLLNDAFPTTVLEAQAMGLPIITTNMGGIPEQISNDNAIVIAPSSDFSQKLADAIKMLAVNETKRKAMGEASLRRSSLFTKEIYASHFFAAVSKYEPKYETE